MRYTVSTILVLALAMPAAAGEPIGWRRDGSGTYNAGNPPLRWSAGDNIVWKTPTPFAGHAIAAAENTVMAAGVPLLPGYSVEDTNASYAGGKGGIAWLLDATDGRQLQELRFDAAPVWDGIAIAHGSYFDCLKDGSVVCLSAR